MPGSRKRGPHLPSEGPSQPGQKEDWETAVSSFPVVGIGASAGGLEALEHFFEHVPAAPGMAFVVILHLAPDHKSHLAELLQNHTSIPVAEVTGDALVEPNHVFIIPPGKDLVLADGRFRLSDPEAPAARRAPIDRFLRTLAQVQGSAAVGIILSGTGSDGTLGLKAVKEAGGLVMVQDPEEAQYDGMPRSALATGIVDVVLPAHELAEKLIAYYKLATTIGLPVREEIPDNEAALLHKILTLLRARTGHDFTHYKRSTVLRRIARRQHICNTEDLAAYLHLLRDSPDEPQALLRDLLITVTNFFRDPETFVALEKDVVPKLFEGKASGDEVRVWVAGCATGEEAYSLAMLLVECADLFDPPPKIQVFATDTSEEAIATARMGRYPNAVAADLTPGRLRRFFTHEGGSYRIRKEIREVVLFAVHDLLKAPPFSRLDLISCRNLLIYLDRDMQERVFELFHYALNPNGYLFLGTSETPVGPSGLFATVSKKHHLYHRGDVTRSAPHLPSLPLVPAPRIPAEPAGGAADRPFGVGALHHQLLELYAPPSLIVNEHNEVLHLSERAGRYLQVPGGNLTHDVLQLVAPELAFELRTALYRAFKDGTAGRSRPVPIQIGEAVRAVRIVVRPSQVPGPQQPVAVVIFEEDEKGVDVAEPPENAAEFSETRTLIDQMAGELQTTKEQLRATVEQYETSNEELKSSNEELQSINEELRSTTEELETSKEELQATNEELVTVNQELKHKIEELAQANSDLQNLMAATEIGTIFLSRDLRVKRFTPPVEQLFNITGADVDRPLAHFTHKLGYQHLLDDAQQVLERLVPIEREVRNEAGRCYLVQLRPYRTGDDRIDGIVITFVDISSQKQTQQDLLDARSFAENLVDTVREPLVVLDADLRVVSVNRSFHDAFQVPRGGAEGRRIYELGNNQWNIPWLRELLEDLLPRDGAFHGFQIDHTFETLGRRVLLINAVRFDDGQLVLLAIEDISRRKAVEAELRQEKNLAQVYLDVADVMVVALDPEGHVTTINRAACEILAYPEDEIVGKDWFEHFLPERDRGPVRKVFETLLTGDDEVTSQYENPVQTRNGDERFVLWHNVVLRNEQDEAVGTISSGTDITQRKRAEAALEESYRFLRSALDALTAHIAIMDEDGTIIAVNEAWNHVARLNGIDPLTVGVGSNYLLAAGSAVGMDADQVAAAAMGLRAVVEARTDNYVMEYPCNASGEERWFVMRISRFKGEGPLRLVVMHEDITERKKVEAANQRLAAIVESSEDAIIGTTLDGVITSWNKGAVLMYGYAAEEVVGKLISIIIPEDRREEADRYLAGTRCGERVDHFETVRIRKDGSLIPVSLGISPVYGTKGTLIGASAIALDITRQKETEDALRESEKRFRDLFEHSPDAIFVENLDGEVLDANPAAGRLHDTDRHTLLGMNVRDLIPHEQRGSAAQDVEKLISGELSYLQMSSWTINRHVVPVEIRATRFVYDGKDAILLLVRDISERIRVEEALEESRARAQAILETTVDAILSIDTKGRIESVNLATEHIFGYSADEMIGQNVKMLMPVPYSTEHDQYLERYLETGQRKIIGVGREVVARRKDGSTFPADLAVSEIRLNHRRIFTGFIRDISDRRRLEHEVLRISEEERLRIGRDLHDGLGSLLTGLAMGAQGLAHASKQGQPVKAEDLEQLAKMVEDGAVQAQALSHVLNPVKLDDKGLPASLKELAVNTYALTRIACSFEAEASLPAINSLVATQLYRIAQEAVNNAVKHAEAEHITIGLDVEQDDLVLTVRDDGTGLHDDLQPREGTGLHIMPYRANLIGATYSIKGVPEGGTFVTCRLSLDKVSQSSPS